MSSEQSSSTSSTSASSTAASQAADPASSPGVHKSCHQRGSCGRSRARKAFVALLLVGVGVAGTLAVTGHSHAHFGSSRHAAMDSSAAQELAGWRVHWMLNKVNATPEQKQQVEGIVRKAIADLAPVREQGRDLREQLTRLLSAPQVDRQALETLRAEKLKTADQVSQRVTQAMADIAQVLTPQQRGQFADMARKRWAERDARSQRGGDGMPQGRGDQPSS